MGAEGSGAADYFGLGVGPDTNNRQRMINLPRIPPPAFKAVSTLKPFLNAAALLEARNRFGMRPAGDCDLLSVNEA
jgi:hypothetical protein